MLREIGYPSSFQPQINRAEELTTQPPIKGDLALHASSLYHEHFNLLAGVAKIDQEMPRVVSIETSANKPRFLGVPQDDQLDESSSMEGILHGRTIQEVHQHDSEELQEAGISWEQGIYVLKYLALANLYQDEQQREQYAQLRQEILGEKEIFEATKEEKEELHRRGQLIRESTSQLIGFRNITAETTGTRVQFDNPINDTPRIGEGTAFDFIAYQGPERELSLENGDVIVVNMPTLYQAEAYHLLEKGNRYEMTGKQLAMITGSFDEQVFHKLLDRWMTEKITQQLSGLQVLPGHQEKLTYSNGNIITFGGGGQYLFLSTEKPSYGISIQQNKGELHSMEINDFQDLNKREIITVENNNYFLLDKDTLFFGKTKKTRIAPENPLHSIIQGTNLLLETSKQFSDGILLSNDSSVQSMFEQVHHVLND